MSEKERTRNEVIYGLQGNRNPFIDYPNLVDYIWGNNTQIAYPFPEESEPFLIYPRNGVTIDMGTLMENSNATQQIEFKGVNLTADLTISLKQNIMYTLSANTISQSAALAGTTLSLHFSPAGSCTARDTLVISGGGIQTLQIPISGLSSNDFITLEADEITPVGGRLHWTADSEATDYQVSVYQGDQRAGNLIISAYVEGSSFNKAIEIYNGTGASIDLADFVLRKQRNGVDAFGEDTQLEGTLAHGATHTIVHASCTNEALSSKANQLDNSSLNFNGNDAIALYRKDIMIDVVGVINDASNWGADMTFERKAWVTHPTTKFDMNEWDTSGIDYFDNIGAHIMKLTESSNYIYQNLPVGTNNFIDIEQLLPNQYYTYAVTSITPSINKQSVNTTQLRTLELDAPQALDPIEVTGNSFTAQWEDNPYIEDHLLNVFQKIGSGPQTDIHDFNTVGSNGKPLPDGWTGTASGNYNSTNSSGVAPNSIALKTNGEYLQTNSHASPIIGLSFMYRYPSSGAGNNLLVEALCGNNWETLANYAYVNTSKYNPEFTFDESRDVRAFRFTFTKVSSNLAIDDIVITYGAHSYVYVEQDRQVSDVKYTVSGLQPENTYYYNVRVGNSNYQSATSEDVKVVTLEAGSGIDTMEQGSGVSVYHVIGGVEIVGLPIGNTVRIYRQDGSFYMSQKAVNETTRIVLNERGIYLIRVDGVQQVYKVVR